MISLLLLLTALNTFFGPACDVEYSLFPDNPAWFELDQTGIDDLKDMRQTIDEWEQVLECHVSRDGVCLTPDEEHEGYDARVDAPAPQAHRIVRRPAPPSYGCRPTQTFPIVPDGTCI